MIFPLGYDRTRFFFQVVRGNVLLRPLEEIFPQEKSTRKTTNFLLPTNCVNCLLRQQQKQDYLKKSDFVPFMIEKNVKKIM